SYGLVSGAVPWKSRSSVRNNSFKTATTRPAANFVNSGLRILTEVLLLSGRFSREKPACDRLAQTAMSGRADQRQERLRPLQPLAKAAFGVQAFERFGIAGAG